MRTEKHGAIADFHRRRLSDYRVMESILREEAETLDNLREILFEVKDTVPRPHELVEPGNSKTAERLKKAGTTLILTAPVPVISDVLGASMFVAGVLEEYRRRKRIRETLSNYIEAITEDIMW